MTLHSSGHVKVDRCEAKSQLSKLVEAAKRGEVVVIARAGRPCVRLVPVISKGTRRLGIDEGVYRVPKDFDGPLSEEILSSFEG